MELDVCGRPLSANPVKYMYTHTVHMVAVYTRDHGGLGFSALCLTLPIKQVGSIWQA